MDFDAIERLMRMLEQSHLNELDVTEGAMRIRLSKLKTGAAPAATAAVADTVTAEAPPPPTATKDVRAGMAGTFYRSPSPGAAPFVETGARVFEGDQLGIIEAMKLLNPVEAECDGVIAAVHIADGDSVEPGTLLFEIAP